MASARSRTRAALIDQLFETPHRFDFFQAVRMLERAALNGGSDDPAAARGMARRPVGLDGPPRTEVVRFRGIATLSFPPSSIVEMKRGDGPGDSEAGATAPAAPGTAALEHPRPHEMTVSFMGLTGPQGVLPVHYTRMLIDRVREKDYSTRDFFDLFNHRTVSLFFRAWEKYRLPTEYERARTRPDARDIDAFTHTLMCMVGMGTAGLGGRLNIDDESLLLYGGFFADAHRSAISLQQMVADYFDLPARVEQFQGQWLTLGQADVSCLPARAKPNGQNCQLGVTTVLGSRVWDVQSRFRVRLGPLSYAQYEQFTPAGLGLLSICHLVRLFVGPEFDFDVQPVLRADEVPTCRLARDVHVKPRLGWNTWLKSQPFARDFDAAAFCREQ